MPKKGAISRIIRFIRYHRISHDAIEFKNSHHLENIIYADFILSEPTTGFNEYKKTLNENYRLATGCKTRTKIQVLSSFIFYRETLADINTIMGTARR